MLAKTLRDDQVAAIYALREAVAEDAERGEPSRTVVQGPTGMGKTVIIADIVDRARQRNKRVLVTVPAISLVDQTVEAINAQGISEIGVIQSNHILTDWSKPVQVASVQTLARRWKDGNMPEADIVLVDEVHRMFNLFAHWIPEERWRSVPFIGFSATPWSKGLGVLYKRLITANNIRDLTEQNVLVPYRAFAPDAPDLSGVRIVAGDFVEADLDEVMRPKHLVANIVQTWMQNAFERPTVCFCCSRAHANQVAKEFEDNGIGAGYMDCETPLTERKAIRQRMLNGDVKVVTNVDVVGIGVDWPEVSCIIYARPTMSDIRYVQNVGRGLRTAIGKQDLLILDHSTTTQRLGFVDEIYGFHDKLDDGKTKPKREVVLLPKECPKCHYLKPPRTLTCPNCGFKPEVVPEEVPVQRGSLKEVKRGDDINDLRKRLPGRDAVFGQLVWYATKKGYNPWWANMKFSEIYGVKFPRGLQYEDKISAPGPDLLDYIYKSAKRWAQRQRRRERWADD